MDSEQCMTCPRTCEIRHVTFGTWLVTCGMLQMTCDMWHVTCHICHIWQIEMWHRLNALRTACMHPWHFQGHVMYDMWHVKCVIWHVTCDMWHVTCNMWQVDMWDIFGWNQNRMQGISNMQYMTYDVQYKTNNLWHVTCDMVTCNMWHGDM